MSADRPWSPIEIEVKIRQVVEAMDNMVLDLKGKAEAAAEAKREFKRTDAKAKARIQFTESDLQLRSRTECPKVDGKAPTVDDRKAWVITEMQAAQEAYIEEVAEAQQRFDMADVEYRTLRDSRELLMHQGDLLRTLARSSRDLSEGFGGGRS